ncbi:hypothetical protein X975_03552, partial [Stegodyphus mimosarum]
MMPFMPFIEFLQFFFFGFTFGNQREKVSPKSIHKLFLFITNIFILFRSSFSASTNSFLRKLF